MTDRMPIRERIPLNTLAIPFGTAGLAEVWTAVADALDWSRAVVAVAWGAAAVVWAAMIVAHVRRGIVTGLPLAAQLRHPVQGPIAVLALVVPVLLSAAALRVWPDPARGAVAVTVVATLLFSAWFIGRLIAGGVPADAVHGGYFLPTVAAGYICAYGLAQAGWRGIAIGCVAFATLAWVATLAVVVARLAVRPPLPDVLVPTLAIIVAPPAVGGLAWFAVTDGRIDDLQWALAGVFAVMVAVQVALVPLYRRTAFTLGFWSFTFPYAAAVTYAIVWLSAAAEAPGAAGAASAVLAVVLAAAITLFVVAIAVRSLASLGTAPGGVGAEAIVAREDDEPARTGGVGAPGGESR
ncbi:hypothetical protein GCM10022200_14400 [Microbacterium awajiense]|uniref:Tellurite resistance protein n=1 Tax=Microbacterium awajiense TaxID=415214 RepID=A0ABP7AHU2_9MICO